MGFNYRVTLKTPISKAPHSTSSCCAFKTVMAEEQDVFVGISKTLSRALDILQGFFSLFIGSYFGGTLSSVQ